MRVISSIEKNKSKQVCFLCGGVNSFEAGLKGIKADGRPYDVLFCKTCGLGKTDPFLDQKKLKGIYSSSVYREDDSTRFFGPVEKIIGFFRTGRCKRVERFSMADANGGKGRILDVGCGRGDFLALMSGRGWDSTGLEMDKRILKRGKNRDGVSLRVGGLEDVKFPDAHFNAITFWHVFEHLRNPDWALKECHRVLKPGGLLVIAVPNAGSLQARLAGRSWFHLDPPYHLYHYSLKNLKSLLDKNGFEVVNVKHLSLEFNPYGYIQSFFNLCGFRANLFYDFLRSRVSGVKGPYLYSNLALMFMLMPLILPASVILSLSEAALKMGGTIEAYAAKKA